MQRGFTLIEMVVASGILAMLLLAGAAFGLGAHPMAMRSASVEFAAQFAAARSLANATGGATILVRPAALSGFTSTVYSGRPSAPGGLRESNVAPVVSDATLREAGLGAPPISIFISGSGHISMAAGDMLGSTLESEPPCPPAQGYTLTFSAGGAAVTVALPCSLAAGGSPVPVVTNSPTPAAAATP